MLTPRDIETKVFKISFRGYNPEEVDDFLQEICDNYVRMFEANKRMKEDADRLSQAVGQYKSMEETITDAARIADKSAGDIESEARLQAKMIIENAELTAKSIVAGAQQKVAEETYRLESIKREVELYKNKIVELLNAQLSVLKGYPQSGNIEFTPVHTQQMWMKKTEEAPSTAAKAEQDAESSADAPEKTRRFRASREFDDTQNLDEVISVTGKEENQGTATLTDDNTDIGAFGTATMQEDNSDIGAFGIATLSDAEENDSFGTATLPDENESGDMDTVTLVDTDKLPRVRMDENGNYVVSDNNDEE